MHVPQASVQTFVLRIWLEETQDEAGRTVWRGHITDVSTGERPDIQDVAGIVAFLSPRLALLDTALKVGLRWRLRSWLKRRRT
jgi:hypothetical protein